MTRTKVLLAGAAAFAALVGLAVAQQPLTAILNGLETTTIALSSGSGANVSVNTIRGGAATRVIPTAGVVGTVVLTAADQDVIMTGAVTGVTFNLPNPGQNGEIIQIGNSSGSGITGVTVVAVAGTQTQTLNTAYAAQAIAATASIEFVYVWTSTSNPTGIWYRLQ